MSCEDCKDETARCSQCGERFDALGYRCDNCRPSRALCDRYKAALTEARDLAWHYTGSLWPYEVKAAGYSLLKIIDSALTPAKEWDR